MTRANKVKRRSPIHKILEIAKFHSQAFLRVHFACPSASRSASYVVNAPLEMNPIDLQRCVGLSHTSNGKLTTDS